MTTFIEDYLADPTLAIKEAQKRAQIRFRNDEPEEEAILKEISSPEFRLYEAIIMCPDRDVSPRAEGFSVVA
jgi:hypothetical protein